MADQAIRYLRFTGLSNSYNQCVLLSELEVYGTRDMSGQPQAELLKTDVNVREGGQGRFYVRLDKEPTKTVVVNVSRSAGSESISIQSGAPMTFNSTCWTNWQAVTLAQAADENADGETATFRISVAGAADQFVTATALDDDIAENLALASGGATIAKSRGSQPGALIDGVHDSAVNYGYTVWTNPALPGTMTLDLHVEATVSRVRLLNWDWSFRVHRYQVESSTDGANWTLLADASGSDRQGWDDWPVADQAIRYLRFTGLSNSYNQCVLVSELEVYGTRAPARRSLASAKDVSAAPDAAMAAESEPVSAVTSDDVAPVYESGWAAVDGDPETAWVGQKAGGGYIVVEYAPALELSALEVDMAEGSLADIDYLYSLDAKEWQPLPEDLEKNPVSLNFLGLVFPDDGTEAVPEVIEIRPNP